MSASIIILPDLSELFEVICDASGVALGVVLGQRRDNFLQPICYATKVQNEAQKNYTVIEHESSSLFTIVYQSISSLNHNIKLSSYQLI